jgi:hypothetical protein
MFNAQLISSLIKGIQPTSAHVLSLTPGQVLMGEVTKILPDQSAMVRFGSTQIHAKLEVPLEVGRKSWFQVQPTSHPITLKILPAYDQRRQASEKNLGPLLQLLGLKNGKKQEQLTQFFLQEKLPMSKSVLQKSDELLQQMGKPQQTLPSIQIAINKGWPLSKEVVQAIRTFLFESPLHHKIADVLPMLPQAQGKALQATSVQLTEVPFQLEETPSHSSEKEVQRPNVLRSFFQMLGLENERNLVSKLQNQLHQQIQQDQKAHQNIKVQLQQLLHDPAISAQAKEKTEVILAHITGQQLFMSTEGNAGLFHQLLFQFSFQFKQKLETLYGQIEGKKNKQGQIDPENCRLIFYLQLASLGETCVDVHIRSKMISITIFNEQQQKEWLQEIKPKLTDALQHLGYNLGNLSWKEPSNGPAQGQGIQNNPYSLRQQYQGVDIRI